jgi:hypothetical protein
MPRQIAICGFADSKDQAPWADDSWEKWVVNDLYAYVPPPGRVHRVFEIHHLLGLDNRRNPNHIAWMQTQAPALQIPVYMQEPRPEFPSSRGLPRQELMECFGDQAMGGRVGCDYFTNSISWMFALALYETSEWVTVKGRKLRLCEQGTKIHMYGVDMAADTEYAAQRPSVEFWVGVGKSMGCEMYIPDNSDILKAPALYGFDTSAPLRVKMQGRTKILREQKMQLAAQRNQVQAQLMEIEKTMAKIDGSVEMAKYVSGVWTMPTEIAAGEVIDPKERTAVQISDGQPDPNQVLAAIQQGGQ